MWWIISVFICEWFDCFYPIYNIALRLDEIMETWSLRKNFSCIIKQIASCITTLIVSASVYINVYSFCLYFNTLSFSQNRQKSLSRSGVIKPSYGKFYPIWLRSHSSARRVVTKPGRPVSSLVLVLLDLPLKKTYFTYAKNY